jgi:hypothetical protein
MRSAGPVYECMQWSLSKKPPTSSKDCRKEILVVGATRTVRTLFIGGGKSGSSFKTHNARFAREV